MTNNDTAWNLKESPLELIQSTCGTLELTHTTKTEGAQEITYFTLSNGKTSEEFRLETPYAIGRGGFFDLRFMMERYALYATLEEGQVVSAKDSGIPEILGLAKLLSQGSTLRFADEQYLRHEAHLRYYHLDTPQGRLWLQYMDDCESFISGIDTDDTLIIAGVACGKFYCKFSMDDVLLLENPEEHNLSLKEIKELEEKSIPSVFKTQKEHLDQIFKALREDTITTLTIVPEDFYKNPNYKVKEEQKENESESNP